MRFPKDLSRSDQLSFGERTLLFFVDETGHELFADPGYPVFGLGGCGVLGMDFGALINQPWREVRQSILGSPDKPLHAAGLSATLNTNQVNVIASYFSNYPIARFGVSCDQGTAFVDDTTTTAIMLAALQNRLNYLLSWTWVTDIVVIFEHSERLERAIIEGFSNFLPSQFGRVLDWLPCFMPKHANEPCLEVADFVAHAVGGVARQQRINSKAAFKRKDFKAIFHSVPNTLATYMHVNEVRRQPTNNRLAA